MDENDQPRSDLDAAIDAVVPALTTVSDETVTASLRRTRIALADVTPRRANAGGAWRWAVPAVAFTTVLVAVMLWHPRGTIEPPWDQAATAQPSAAPAPPLRSVAPLPVPSIAMPPRVVRPQRLARAPRVEATSVARVDQMPRQDPLVALVNAVQRIPEDAWRSGLARAEGPIAGSEVELPAIEIVPIETPPVGDLPTE